MLTEGTKIYEFRVTTLIHHRLTPIASASTGFRRYSGAVTGAPVAA